MNSFLDAVVRILLANAHWIVRGGLVALLDQESNFGFVGFAEDGVEADQKFQLLKPDVVLLDLRGPTMDGLELTRYLVEKLQARILIFTTLDSEEDLKQSLKAGVKGYLLKEVGRKEIIEAIRVVARGGNYFSPRMAGKVANLIGRTELSVRELTVLRLMCDGKSNKEIGSDLGTSEGTVKTYAKRIFQKLRVVRRSQAVSLALKRGLVAKRERRLIRKGSASQ